MGIGVAATMSFSAALAETLMTEARAVSRSSFFILRSL